VNLAANKKESPDCGVRAKLASYATAGHHKGGEIGRKSSRAWLLNRHLKSREVTHSTKMLRLRRFCAPKYDW
jgi:hypothetical protein